MGMAFKEISTLRTAPFFETLVEQGQLEEPVFGFYLAESDSELIIGGSDNSRYSGNLTYVNVVRQVRISRGVLCFVLTRTRYRVSGRPRLMLYQSMEVTLKLALRRRLLTQAPPSSLATKSLSRISMPRSLVRPRCKTPAYGQVRLSRCLTDSVANRFTCTANDSPVQHECDSIHEVQRYYVQYSPLIRNACRTGQT